MGKHEFWSFTFLNSGNYIKTLFGKDSSLFSEVLRNIS